MARLTLRQRAGGLWLYWKLRRRHAGRHRESLRLLWSGELDLARHWLEAGSEPSAALELACLELEAGDIEAADRWMRQMPDDPTRAVLAALIAARVPASPFRGGGQHSWLAALIAAWREAGRPDLHASPHLSQDFFKSYDTGRRSSCPDPDARALWMWMTRRFGLFGRSSDAPMRRWAAARVDRELPDLVIAAQVLAKQTDVDLVEAYRRVLARMCELAPGHFWIQLVAFVQRHPGPLGTDALGELEAMAEASIVDAGTSPAIHNRLLGVAASSGSRTPEPMAFEAALGTLMVLPTLGLATQLTEPRDRRAAELCIRLGRRMVEDRYLITFLFGGMFMRKGATVLDDQRVFNELAATNTERAYFSNVLRTPKLDPLRWPLPSLAREIIAGIRSNELAFQRAALKRELEG